MTAVTKGPCSLWVTAEDVIAECDLESSDTVKAEQAAQAASELLYELSGEQFTGECEEVVRPCRVGCGCSFSWNGVGPGPGWYWSAWGLLGWGWGYDGAADLCGCGAVSQVLIPGYPVTGVTEVRINDEVVDPWKYEVRDNMWLVRLSDNDDPEDRAFWPACQDMSQPLPEDGTWSVTATFGQAPPMLGQLAAKQLACEIILFLTTGECDIPATATQINRQGLTIERVPFIAWGIGSDGTWGTGLQLVDAFLSAYNPIGMVRRPSVWSPDIAQYAQDVPVSGT